MADMHVELKRRSWGDVALLAIFAVGMFVYGVYEVVTFVRGGSVNGALLVDAVALLCGVVILLLVISIFLNAYRHRQPFARSIIARLWIVGLVLALSAFVPHMLTALVMIVKVGHYEFVLTSWNLLVFLSGLIVATLSNMFIYGQRLQQDMDQIA